MTETTAAPRIENAPAFPNDRTCPYQLPAEYGRLRDGAALERVTLYDGRTVWVVTKHEVAAGCWPTRGCPPTGTTPASR